MIDEEIILDGWLFIDERGEVYRYITKLPADIPETPTGHLILSGQMSDMGKIWDGQALITPPAKPAHYYIWSADGWSDPRPPEALKQVARDAAKARRDVAIGGGTVIGGLPVYTDSESRNFITGAALSAVLDPDYTVAWKAASGAFITLTAAQVIGLASGVRAHVQSCFDREAAIVAAIEVGDAYDLDEGWPEGL